jgi:hypothetical protein
MKRLPIVFSEPLSQRLGVTLTTVTCLIAALGWLGDELWRANELHLQVQAQQEALNRLRSRTARAEAASRREASMLGPAQVAAANAIIRRLNLPWHGLFDAIEAAAGPNVSVVAIEPDAQQQLVEITAEAAEADQMVGFVTRLKQQAPFAQVDLRRHRIDDHAPGQPLQFTVDASWRDGEANVR